MTNFKKMKNMSIKEMAKSIENIIEAADILMKTISLKLDVKTYLNYEVKDEN